MDKTKLRTFEIVERRHYEKVIRVQFSSDRPNAEEFIKKSIKEERLIDMPHAGLGVAEKFACSKCSAPVCVDSIICNDCSGCSKCGVKKQEGN